jgi:hypothetical protein
LLGSVIRFALMLRSVFLGFLGFSNLFGQVGLQRFRVPPQRDCLSHLFVGFPHTFFDYCICFFLDFSPYFVFFNPVPFTLVSGKPLRPFAWVFTRPVKSRSRRAAYARRPAVVSTACVTGPIEIAACPSNRGKNQDANDTHRQRRHATHDALP